MKATKKEVPINPNLSAKRCWDMVNRIETVKQSQIAEAWLNANVVISVEEYDDLMRALSYLRREAYRERRLA